MEETTEAGLVRGIRKWDLVALIINSMVGAGIFVLPARAFGLIGPYSLLAFVVCALVASMGYAAPLRKPEVDGLAT